MFLRHPVHGGMLRPGQAIDPAAGQSRRNGDRDRGSSEDRNGLTGRRLGSEFGSGLARIVVGKWLHVAYERPAAFDLQLSV